MVPRYDIAYFPLGAAAFGGAERTLIELASEMSRVGRKVALFAEESLRATPFTALAAENGLEIIWLDWAPERNRLHNLVAALRVFKTLDADLVHFNISWRRGMWLVGLVARVMTRAKILGVMHAMPDPHHLTPRRRWFRVVPGLQLWRVPEVLAGHVWAKILHMTVSVNAGDFPARLVRHFGFRRTRLRVIHNGIQIRKQPLEPGLRSLRRATFGVSEDEILICYVGRLSIEKGVHILLDALACLPSHFKLIIAGEGPQAEDLKALTRTLDLHARIDFLGFIGAPGDYIAASDIIVVPSTWHEAFGLVVVEGMNEAVPVVSSKVGGMAELYEDGVEGVYFRAGCTQSLASALRELGTDPDRRRQMGLNARIRVEQAYTIERMRDEYGLVYDELLAAKAGAAALDEGGAIAR